MTIAAICNREVITVKPEASIAHVAKLMRQYHVGDVVVIDERKHMPVPIGIVTDRDIVVEVIATALDAEVMTASDIMQKKLLVIAEDFGVFQAIKTMTSKGVRRLPVVDDKGGLIGIITLDDLFQLLSKELAAMSASVIREQQNESSKRK
jgi:CBS domain-containing protein